jgi:succinate dehydrogenase / fumarate reductase flavoprotein subunit
VVKARYGELFPMYQNITNEDPLKTPMKIYPAVHYTMGGLWVDYELMTSVQGLYALGEANFSDHGANRLRCFCFDARFGRWLLRYSLHYRKLFVIEIFTNLSPPIIRLLLKQKKSKARAEKLINIKGKKTVDDFHKELGKIMWEYCGMARTAEGLTKARKLFRICVKSSGAT